MRYALCAVMLVLSGIALLVIPSCNQTEQDIGLKATQEGVELAVPLALNMISDPTEASRISGIIYMVSTDALKILNDPNDTKTLKSIIDAADPKAAAVFNYVFQVLPSGITASLDVAVNSIPSTAKLYMIAAFTGAQIATTPVTTVSTAKSFKAKAIGIADLKAKLNAK